MHGELQKLGFAISESSVACSLRRIRRRGDSGKRWLAFLQNDREAIVAFDFFWPPIHIDLGLARLELRLKRQEVPPVLLQSKYLRARTNDLINIEVSAEQARVAGNIASKPLVVLTGEESSTAA